MDSVYNKERIETLKIRASVARKFKDFCKELSDSQSSTLLLLLEFFKRNAVFPNDITGSQFQTPEDFKKKWAEEENTILMDCKENKSNPKFKGLQSSENNECPIKKPLIKEQKPNDIDPNRYEG